MQAAGVHGEALRRLADRLCAEFPSPLPAERYSSVSTLAAEGGLTGILGPEDEALVAKLRACLASVAASFGAVDQPARNRLLETTLDGAEFVIRGELETGNAEHLLRLMPSFVFLAALAVSDQDRALEASKRTAELADLPSP